MPPGAGQRDDWSAVRFPEWHDVLNRAALTSTVREHYRGAVVAFLRHCKVHRSPGVRDADAGLRRGIQRRRRPIGAAVVLGAAAALLTVASGR